VVSPYNSEHETQTDQMVGRENQLNQIPLNATKAKILQAAQQLMLCQGYNASSIDDLCAKANVKKGSFFHYFKTKEQLAQETLRDFLETSEKNSQSAAYRRLTDPLDRVLGYIDFIASLTLNPKAPKNCLLGIIGGELSETMPALREQCQEYFAAQIEAMKLDLDLAKKQLKIKTQLDTRSLAESFISTFQGSLILRRVNQDPGMVSRNLEHFKKYIQMVYTKKEQK
jgi:TetR/AcrR family transcriptional repressor of nem operon